MTAAATFVANTSPYLGLRNYNEEDADFFFGRDQERDIIIANLKASRLTVLYGPSGVGKTSLLRAGVEASLRKLARTNHARLGTPEFVTVVFDAWRDDPGTGLCEAIAKEVEQLTDGPADPAASLAETIMAAARRTDASLLVMLDQFEDFSLYHSSRNGASTFAGEFPQLVNDKHLPVNFLVSISEDAIAQLDRFKSSIPGLLDTRLRVHPLMGGAASVAVTGPITRYNEIVGPEASVTIEDELVTAVLRQVEVGKVRRKHAGQGLIAGARRSGSEPDIGTDSTDDERTLGVEASYLQLVMTRLWEREMSPTTPGSNGARTLRLATLQELGGAQTIVREHLHEALSDLSHDESDAAADVFQYLVTPSGTKITQGLGTLVAWSRHSSGEVTSLLAKLEGDARIIRPVPPEPGTDEPRYEIFHDVLAGAILEWSAEESEKRRLADLAHDNERLEQQKHQAEERAAVERRRRLFAVALMLVALAGGVAAVAFWRSAVAERNTARQEKARATYVGLASTAQALLQTRPDISLLLALEAYLHTPPRSPKVLAQSTLMAALEELRRSGVIGVLHGHTDTVTSVAFDPNRPMLASASGDGTIRLWDTRTLRQVGKPLSRPHSAVFNVAFSPDGRTLASAQQDGTVLLWDVASQRLVGGSRGPKKGAAISVAFSPDGRKLAAASLRGDIRLWDVIDDRRLVKPIDLNDPTVRSIAFGPGTEMLAAVGDNSTIKLWDVSAGPPLEKAIYVKAGHAKGPLYAVAFRPGGHMLAAGGLDGTVWLWDLASPNPIALPSRTVSPIYGVAFSHDGRTLASARADDTIQLWDVARKTPRGPPITGHTGIVTSVAFSSDGNTLASGSTDKTIRLWDPQPHRGFGDRLISTTRSVGAVAFTSNDKTLAWAYQDRLKTNAIQLWDVRHAHPIARLPTQYGGLRSVAFSPDGRLLVSTSNSGSVQLWNVHSRQRQGKPIVHEPGVQMFSAAFSPHGSWLAFAGANGTLELGHPIAGGMRPLRAPAGDVYTVAFNDDGSKLASGGNDRTIQLWDVATGQPIRTLRGHTSAVFSVAFSPNGAILASGSADDTVRLWNVSTGSQIGQALNGHRGFVRSVAFSPDGRTLASGSADGTIRLWDVASGTQLGEALGSNSFIETVAFSPDGRSLASGGREGEIRLWTPISLPHNNAALIKVVCGFVGTGLSPAERSQYAPALAHHDPCR